MRLPIGETAPVELNISFNTILAGLDLEVVLGIILHGRDTILLKAAVVLAAFLPQHREDLILDLSLKERER